MKQKNSRVKNAGTEPAAAKSIILFSDGTGNSSAKLFKTNVWRMYEAVDLGPTQPGQQRQIAYYDDGVGNSVFKPLRMLQGAFGIGLRRNVLELYSYTCRNYDPHSRPLSGSGIERPGDHIYGFGFSRGAFTMRLVIALIASEGLIPYESDDDLKWKVKAAWKRFRRRWPRSIDWLLRKLGLANEQDPADFAACVTAEDGARARSSNIQDSGEGDTVALPGEKLPPKTYDPSKNHHPVIRMIGAWDTVAAYGGPIVEITRAIDNFLYRLSMPNYVLHPRVMQARHALALDDERDSFRPLLWDELAERAMRPHLSEDDYPWMHSTGEGEERLQQVWFTGMHADVGGGYPDESLSYVSLLWMLEGAHKCGLRTVDVITDRYHALANSFGPIHDSRSGLAAYYRYQPRRISSWEEPVDQRTLSARDPAIRNNDGTQRGLVELPGVHASVFARIASGTDGYAPIVLPARFKVVPAGGMVETRFQATSGGQALSPAQALAARSNPPPLVPPQLLKQLHERSQLAVESAMEGAWHLVWWRRMVYFATLAATLLLLAMPWWVPGGLTEIIHAGGGALVEPLLVPDGRNALGNIIRLPAQLLPDFLGIWFEAWAAAPFWFLLFGFAILVLWGLGSWLNRRIRDQARAAWHSVLPRIPPATVKDSPKPPSDYEPRGFHRIRNSRAYQRALQIIKWQLVPNLIAAPLLSLLLVWGILSIATQAALPLLEGGSRLCPQPHTAPSTLPQVGSIAIDFHAKELCHSTGHRLVADARYSFDFDRWDDWKDGKEEATPMGLDASELGMPGIIGIPLRRVIDARYLQPIIAIRSPGEGGLFNKVRIYPLRLDPVPGEPTRYRSEFVAPATGELFLFVNDAVLPFAPAYFYGPGPGPNQGTACVRVRDVRFKRPDPPGEGAVCRSTSSRQKARQRAVEAALGAGAESPPR